MYIVVEQQNQWYFFEKRNRRQKKETETKLVKQNLVKNFSVSSEKYGQTYVRSATTQQSK